MARHQQKQKVCGLFFFSFLPVSSLTCRWLTRTAACGFSINLWVVLQLSKYPVSFGISVNSQDFSCYFFFPSLSNFQFYLIFQSHFCRHVFKLNAHALAVTKSTSCIHNKQGKCCNRLDIFKWICMSLVVGLLVIIRNKGLVGFFFCSQ